MKISDIITEAVKQRLDAKCWAGKHKEGTKIKGGVRVNNCVPNESVEETAAKTGAILVAVFGWTNEFCCVTPVRTHSVWKIKST